MGSQASDRLDEFTSKAKESLKKGEQKIKPVFDDIKNLSDARVKKLIKDLDAEDLVAALKDAESELVNKVLPNMSKSARKKYDDLQDNLKVKQAEVKRIRKHLEDKLRGLF
ncbi:MAG: FliG C-terminal domain-containing protein [Bacteroidales bacterium]|nr:FliG C-terminal domain-containing protein [Bacteroidales bacterium]